MQEVAVVGLSRRSFGRAVLALGAVSAVSTLPIVGCTSSDVINEINVVLQQAGAVLAVALPNESWVAPLQKAIGALMAAETQWRNGGAVDIVINALNTIMAITAVVPLTAQYSPLIDILVAGIEAILVALPRPAASVKMVSAVENPHIGRTYIKRRWYHGPAADFKAQWNAVAQNTPQLAVAVLK